MNASLFRRIRVSWCLSLAGISISVAAAVLPTDIDCAAHGVVLRVTPPEDAADACQGVRTAVAFLRGLSLEIPAGIGVEIVESTPAPGVSTAYGSYDPESRRVRVLGLSALRRRGTVFGQVPGPGLFQAVVAHEVAHAIAAANFRYAPTMLGQEYIAYLTLFTAMPVELRRPILQRFDYDPDWRLYALLLYMSDPLEFGAHAWRHFQSHLGGPAFVQRILEGSVFDY